MIAAIWRFTYLHSQFQVVSSLRGDDSARIIPPDLFVPLLEINLFEIGSSAFRKFFIAEDNAILMNVLFFKVYIVQKTVLKRANSYVCLYMQIFSFWLLLKQRIVPSVACAQWQQPGTQMEFCNFMGVAMNHSKKLTTSAYWDAGHRFVALLEEMPLLVCFNDASVTCAAIYNYCSHNI